MAKRSRHTKRRKKGGRRAKKNRKGRLKKKFFLFLLALLLVVLATGALFYYTVRIGVFGKLPDAQELAHIKQSEASELLTSDRKVIGRYFVQNRTNASFKEIPQDVIDALVATEDARFFEHEGIDPVSVARVVFKTLILGDRSAGGGSTISQQLAKNLYGRENHDLLSLPVNKMKENIIALDLEDIYTKQEIIQLYLNTVPFGERVYGIETASMRYFGKHANALSVPEAATLIGMLKAPTRYSPRLNPERSKVRRNVVLHQMVKYDYLDQARYKKIVDKPITLNYTNLQGPRGLAPYFSAMLQPVVNKEIADLQKSDGSAYDLYTDGLRIITTVNSRLQNSAYKAVHSQMKKLQSQFDSHWKGRHPLKNNALIDRAMKRSTRYKRAKKRGLTKKQIEKEFNTPVEMHVYTPVNQEVKTMSPRDSIIYHQMILQAGFLAMNPQSGAVKAYVGGINYRRFPYDHVHSRRQVGSTFKPVVYLTALEEGLEPCKYISTSRKTYEEYDDYSPRNADGNYEGYYNMRGALANSVNTVSVKILMETGIDRVIRMANALGITSDLPEGPSLALGTANVSLAEMVRAYTVFPSGGKLARPFMIRRIENSRGEVLKRFETKRSKEVVQPEDARTILGLMEDVTRAGTGRAIRQSYGIHGDVAGKTGTTQNNSDGWFIACTPRLVCGAWVGGESPAVRFRSTALGQGAHMALPIVGRFLAEAGAKAPSISTSGSFSQPSNKVREALECDPYIDSKMEHFLDKIFGGKNNEKLPEENLGLEKKQEKQEEDDEEDKPGFFKRLFGGGEK